MGFVPVPNGVRVSIEFILDGLTVVITLSFLGQQPADAAKLVQLAQAVEGWIATDLSSLLSEDISATTVKAQALDSESAPSIVWPISPPIAGEDPAEPLPANVALVTTFQTSKRGRSYRGRVYTPGLPSNALTNAYVFNGAGAAALSAVYAALSTVEAATEMTHVVISRRADGAPRTTGVATPITAYRTGVVPDTQRRRLPRSI
jgi:hypothetical protein